MGKKHEKINLEEIKQKHESDLTKEEKRLLEKEKLKDMNFIGKLEYIWMYYKPVLCGILVFIVLIFVGVDVYQNLSENTVLSIAIIDAGTSDTVAFTEEIREILGMTGKNDCVDANANYVTSTQDDGLDYYSQMAFVTQVQAKALDVVLLPQKSCEVFEEQGYFADLKELLGEETYAAFGDAASTCHLELSADQVGKGIEVLYDPICVAVFVNAPHSENAAAWLASLAE